MQYCESASSQNL